MIRKVNFKRVLFIMTLAYMPYCHAGFFAEKSHGWHWYEEPKVLSEEPLQDNKEMTSNNKTATDVVKAYQKELEKRLHAAWVSPTHQNVENYQRLQKEVLDRAELFSKSWMQVVFNHQELDHTLIAPVNQKARHLQLDEEKKLIAQSIKTLAEEYGLFFFFSSGCEYCHQFAPIVKRFSETHGWEVLAISVDGGRLEGFKSEQDNGLAKTWGIEMLPALFAVNPNNGHVIPVAYGMASLDEMEMRIMALIETKDNP